MVDAPAAGGETDSHIYVPLRGKLDRVGKQILEDLLESLRVADEEARQIGGELDVEREVFVLGQSRGGSEVKEIALPREPRWMVFSIEMDTTQFPSYRAILTDSNGKEIWQQQGIQPGSPDAIGVTVPSILVAPGFYALTIEPASLAGARSTLNRFHLSFK